MGAIRCLVRAVPRRVPPTPGASRLAHPRRGVMEKEMARRRENDPSFGGLFTPEELASLPPPNLPEATRCHIDLQRSSHAATTRERACCGDGTGQHPNHVSWQCGHTTHGPLCLPFLNDPD